MSRNLTGSVDLATKYAVGEVVDMVGTPAYYDAGTSKWMQGATWMGKTAVATAVAALLGSNASNVATASLYNQSKGEGSWVTVGSVSVRHMNLNGSYVLVSTGSGLQSINTGITTTSGVTVVSNGTFFLAVAKQTASPGSTTGIAKSTDGVNWTLQTITWTASRGLGGSHVKAGEDAAGVAGNGSPQYAYDVFWAGSRFVAITTDGTNIYALRSSDGLTWTDDSSTVLGAASISYIAGYSLRYSVNGNNSWVFVGSGTSRYSNDGGVTWGNSTNIGIYSSNPIQYGPSNETLVTCIGSSIYVSTNSGQSWTDRTSALNFGGTCTSVAINKVSSTTTIIAAYNMSAKKSTDGGATWSIVNLPGGVLGTLNKVFSDGTNFYATTLNFYELLVSTDSGVTWTLRATNSAVDSLCIARRLDANRVVLLSGNATLSAAVSADNGVTWKFGVASPSTSGGVANVGVIPGVGVHIGEISGSYSCTITVADIDAGYGWIRASSTTPNAIRTNSTPMIRVA